MPSQSGRLTHSHVVRYIAIMPGQFSTGTDGQFSTGSNTGFPLLRLSALPNASRENSHGKQEQIVPWLE